MKIVAFSNESAKNITLDDLYRKAHSYGLEVDFEDRAWGGNRRVELKYRNEQGSTFWFRGESTDSITEAFLKAFEQASLIGMGYD